MKRTTIFIDEGLLARARRFAKQEQTSFASLVREALAAYLAEGEGGAVAGVPAISGAFASGKADTSARVDELLWTDPHG